MFSTPLADVGSTWTLDRYLEKCDGSDHFRLVLLGRGPSPDFLVWSRGDRVDMTCR